MSWEDHDQLLEMKYATLIVVACLRLWHEVVSDDWYEAFFLNLMASRVICQRIIFKAKLGKNRLKDNILLQHWLWKQHHGLISDMMMITTIKMSMIAPLLLNFCMLQSGQWKTMTGQFSFAQAVFQWDLYLTGRQSNSPVFQLEIYICPTVKLVLCPAQYAFYNLNVLLLI